MRELSSREVDQVDGGALPVVAAAAGVGISVLTGASVGALGARVGGYSPWAGAALGGATALLTGIGGVMLTSGVAGMATAGTTLTGLGAVVGASGTVALSNEGASEGQPIPANAGS